MFGIKTNFINHARDKWGWFMYPEVIKIMPIRYACNHNCPMCWRQHLSVEVKKQYVMLAQDDLKLDDYITLINNLPKSIKRIEIVGGGEPLLYKDLPIILREIKKRNIHGVLITNGSLLTPELVKELISIQWDVVSISIHASNPKTYARVNGVNHYSLVTDNIKSIIKKRTNSKLPKLVLYFVIQKYNYDDIIPFAEMAKRLNVDRIEYGSLIKYPTIDVIDLNKQQYRQVLETLRTLENQTHLENNIVEIKDQIFNSKIDAKRYKKTLLNSGIHCPIFKNNLEILTNGNVLPCCIAFGHVQGFFIRDYSISEIWSKYSYFRKQILKGEYFDFCKKYCTMWTTESSQ